MYFCSNVLHGVDVVPLMKLCMYGDRLMGCIDLHGNMVDRQVAMLHCLEVKVQLVLINNEGVQLACLS